jgi:hypothetical protein
MKDAETAYADRHKECVTLVESITEALAAKAREIRHRPCPPNHCPKCYMSYCRLLLTGCCLCTGHVLHGRPDMSRFFPNDRNQQRQQQP